MTFGGAPDLHTIINRAAMRLAANDGLLHQKCARSICRRRRDCRGISSGRECVVHWRAADWTRFSAMCSFAQACIGKDGRFLESDPPAKGKARQPLSSPGFGTPELTAYAEVLPYLE